MIVFAALLLSLFGQGANAAPAALPPLPEPAALVATLREHQAEVNAVMRK